MENQVTNLIQNAKKAQYQNFIERIKKTLAVFTRFFNKCEQAKVLLNSLLLIL